MYTNPTVPVLFSEQADFTLGWKLHFWYGLAWVSYAWNIITKIKYVQSWE